MNEGVQTTITPPVTSRLADGLRGLWQITLYVVVVAIGLAIVAFGVVSQFDPEPARAFRGTIVLCGGGLAIVGALLGVIVTMILATRHFSTATSAGMQRALETTSHAQQAAISALTHQMEVSNARQEAVINTLANVFAANAQRQQYAVPSAPQAVPQVGPAREDVVIAGVGVQYDQTSIERAASMIHNSLYERGVQPTRENIKREIPSLRANELIKQAQEHLRALGWVTGGGTSGKPYMWREDLVQSITRDTDDE